MSAVDDCAFSYVERKNGSVSIFWYKKLVTEISNKNAAKFLSKISKANDEEAEQLIMAKATGNFKRGNEKDNK